MDKRMQERNAALDYLKKHVIRGSELVVMQIGEERRTTLRVVRVLVCCDGSIVDLTHQLCLFWGYKLSKSTLRVDGMVVKDAHNLDGMLSKELFGDELYLRMRLVKE